MKQTAQQIYDTLINTDRILEVQGQIKFFLGEVQITVKQKDVVGNIMQEWLQGWMDKNNIEYALGENSQMPPDFFLDPEDLTHDLLEVKAFNRSASPGFDIADFKSYQKEIIDEPWMLHSDYLIFGYDMSDDGIVTIKDIWLKKVWELCRPMANYALNLQVKNKMIHKIRPGIWWGDDERRQFRNFGRLEHFISAIDEMVYRNPETREISGTWLSLFKRSYREKYGIELSIPRWEEIQDIYKK